MGIERALGNCAISLYLTRRTFRRRAVSEGLFVYWILHVWQNTLNFSGRAGRREYFMYKLCAPLLVIGLSLLASAILPPGGLAAVQAVLCLLVGVPQFALEVRRLHDVGYCGWWVLCPPVLWVAQFSAGSEDSNQYGERQTGGPAIPLWVFLTYGMAAAIGVVVGMWVGYHWPLYGITLIVLCCLLQAALLWGWQVQHQTLEQEAHSW